MARYGVCVLLLLAAAAAHHVDPVVGGRPGPEGDVPAPSGSPEDRARAAHCSPPPEATVQAILNDFRIRFYYGNTSQEYSAVPLDQLDKLVNNLKWQHDRCATLYIFDYLDSADSPRTKTVMQGYLGARRRGNALLLDWAALAARPYEQAAGALARTARAVARALRRLPLPSARPALCHVAGHGLGAHLAGHVARRLPKPLAPPLVVGLDPSGALFHPARAQCERPLGRGDARCVQVLHSVVGARVGGPGPAGHVDVFVNGARHRQPACEWAASPEPQCSHEAVLGVWAEALQRPETLVATRCASWENFQRNLCDRPRATLQLGEPCHGLTGNFYLWTRGRAPVGLGPRGAHPGPRPPVLPLQPLQPLQPHQPSLPLRRRR